MRRRAEARNAGALALCALAALPCAAHGQSSGGGHDTAWNFSGGADGIAPRGDALIDSAGNIYGTASSGGVSGNGAVYMLVPPTKPKTSGVETTLYDFTGGADGSVPNAGLVGDAAGAVYGTAVLDGVNSGGTVFRLSPPASGQTAWTQTTLWSFGAAADGASPMGSLVFDSAGSLYGTTDFGGSSGQGTVFRLSPPSGGFGPWTETVLWSFSGGADGANPVAGLAIDSAGALYGTTKAGGASGAGTVFRLKPSTQSGWTETTLRSFSGQADGAAPSSTLVPDGNGGFYGTAEFGGTQNGACDQARYPYYNEPDSETKYAAKAAYVPPGGNGCGVVFYIAPPAGGGTPWTESVVWPFTGGTDGANPSAAVLVGAGGTLYGLTTEYGQEFWGTAYALVPGASGAAGTLTTLVYFNGKDQGFYPRGALSLGLGGRLFATNSVGGKTWVHISNYGYGTIFSIAP